MVSRGGAADDETSSGSASASESSDSHSYLLWDIENPSGRVNEEWEAIERTLYQENGKHVTDPALLKECQLWRETFLHLRARGTAISGRDDASQEEKSVQAVDENQLPLSELEERRRKIREATVSQIVERLASKLCLSRENSRECGRNGRTIEEPAGAKADNESYYERGKKKIGGEDLVKGMNFEVPSEAKSPFLLNANDDFECNSAADIIKSETSSRFWSGRSDERQCLTKGRSFASNLAKNEEILRSENLRFKITERPPLKTEASTSDSLSSIAKPFEMTKKIDRKYEVMLERILDGKRITASAGDKRNSPKSGIFGGKSTTDPKMAEQTHLRKQLPRISNFTNNWMTRAEQNFLDHRKAAQVAREPDVAGFRNRREPERSWRAVDGSSRSASNASNACQFDEGFFEDLKQEMWIQKQCRTKRLAEEVNLRKLQPRPRGDQCRAARTQKSSSCGDLPKRAPRVKGRAPRSGLEKGRSDASIRGRKREAPKKAAPQNLQLPPIEANQNQAFFEVKNNVTRVISMFKTKWPIKEWKRYGFFDDDYLTKINIYWLQFPPPAVSSHYILGILYIFIMVIGVSGNLLFMVTFIRRKTLRTPSNIFVMNLATSDFFLLLKMPVFIYNSFLRGPALGELGCAIYGFFGGLTGTVSIMTLSAIAFDRYQVIAHPLTRKIKQTVYNQVLLIWLYSAFFATMPLLDIGFNKYVPEGYLTSCSFDYLSDDASSRFMIIVFFFAAWVVPVSIIVSSYIAIYRVILRTQKAQKLVKVRHCKKMEERRTEVKAAVIIVVMVSLWIFAWTPYAVVALLGVTGNKKYITPLSSMIPALFCKTASCLDPYIYAMTNSRFQTELKNWIRGRSVSNS